MKRRSFLAYGAAAALLPTLPEAARAAASALTRTPPASAEDAAARIGEFVELVRYHWRVPGIAVAVIHQGRPLMAAGFGIKSVASAAPVDAHTAFNIGSCTKAYTACAAALLVDEGRIGWDDPVKRVLPELELYDPAVTAQVTLRDFLSCRAGLSRACISEYGSDLSRAQVIARAKDAPEKAPFRSRFCYSDLGFIIAAEAIARIAGEPFERFVERRILGPLGMADSAAAGKPWLTLRNLAEPHDFWSHRVRAIPPRDYDNLMGAGAVSVSAADAVAWLRLQLGAGSIVSAANLAEMHTAQIPAAPVYGLGWRLGTSEGRRRISHGGEVRGFTAYTLILPEQGHASFVASNAETHAAGAVSAFIDRLLNSLPPHDELDDYDIVTAQAAAAAAQRYEADRKADPLDAPGTLPLEAFAGTYRNRGFGTLALRAEPAGLRFAIAEMSIYDGWLVRYGGTSFAHQEDGFPGKVQPPRPIETLDSRVHFRLAQREVVGLEWLDKWFGPVAFERM